MSARPSPRPATAPMSALRPFADFVAALRPQVPLRAAITAAYRRPEPDCLAPLLDLACMPTTRPQRSRPRPGNWWRRSGQDAPGRRRGPDPGIFALEPGGRGADVPRRGAAAHSGRRDRDALIRDKIARRRLAGPLGHSPRCSSTPRPGGSSSPASWPRPPARRACSAALTRLIARGGEPLIRKGVDLAMRMMGEQFVTGQTIEEALAQQPRAGGARLPLLLRHAGRGRDDGRGRRALSTPITRAPSTPSARRQPGAASTRGRASRSSCRPCIRATAARKRERVHGRAAAAREGAGRCWRSATTSASTSTPRRRTGWRSRSTCSKRCALDPELAGWNGIGFVVQAYGKRCPFVVDWLIDLARRSEAPAHGAAGQGRLLGQRDQARAGGRARRISRSSPARSTPTSSYLACARKLLARARRGLPAIRHPQRPDAGGDHRDGGAEFLPGQYEFQCLHGMGEPLYEEVVGPDKLDRPCRIYAPVGTHETLLAYLVRRLLENGANSSFVNRIADRAVPVEELIADPVATARAMPAAARRTSASRCRAISTAPSAANSRRARPRQRTRLAELAAAPARERGPPGQRAPIRRSQRRAGNGEPVAQPGRPSRRGRPRAPTPRAEEIETALARPPRPRRAGLRRPRRARAACLRRAADLMEARMPVLIGLIVREAGKSFPTPSREVREAVDFLRYYAARGRADVRATGTTAARAGRLHRARGISRWRFSPARSRRPWRPATRCWPSPPRRRR